MSEFKRNRREPGADSIIFYTAGMSRERTGRAAVGGD